MTIKKNRHIKLWLVVIIAIVFWTIGAGSYRKLSANNEETYKGLKLFSDVIELVEKNYVDPVDSKELIMKAIHGMVNSLDPHSQFLPPDSLNDLQIDTQGKFTGIGIQITMRKGFVTVISPIEGTPAYKAGIKAKDKIIKVDGEPTNDFRDAVKRMRGPKGTTVIVTIIREGLQEPIDFKLVRDVIPNISVKSTELKPGYGYIRITNFRENTPLELKAALAKLESGDVALKGLILDLRSNPGGLLIQSIEVSDLFLENGIIVSIKGRLKSHTKVYKAHANEIQLAMRNGFVTVISLIEGTPAYKAGIKARDKIIKVDGEKTKNLSDAVNRMKGPKGTTVIVTILREGLQEPIDFKLVRDVIPNSYPMIVLINGGSASASEIVAGALQDNKRALILGTNSFGKGSVQTVETLRDGYGIKFTIARYYTPSGRTIQAQGIIPNIIVKMKTIDDKGTDESSDGLLKEKDLKNHLKAVPKDSKEKDVESDKKENDDEFNHDLLKLEGLESDNQVVRALQILMSYDIFKDMQG